MTPIPVKDLDKERAWSGGGLLPPGRHLCSIIETEETTSANGHPQMILKLEAVAGEHEGGQIKDFVVVIPSTYGKVKSILESAGIEVQPGEWSLNPETLRGCTVSIFVKEKIKPDGSTISEVVGYSLPRSSDIPADTEGLPSGPSKADDDIPF